MCLYISFTQHTLKFLYSNKILTVDNFGLQRCCCNIVHRPWHCGG